MSADELNADKCKEMVIDFERNSHNFSPLEVDGNDLPVTDCAKILGVTMSSDLKWNNHIVDCIKKANKRLYFVALLKRARVPSNDIVNFYCTTIRPVLDYCTPVFHHTLAAYLNNDIERIQKRVLSIISPHMSYRECLDSLGLPMLYDLYDATNYADNCLIPLLLMPDISYTMCCHKENNSAIT